MEQHITALSSAPVFFGRQPSFSTAGKSYKEKKEDERRARAGDSAGWNASFVRADTVVDALADRLGVGKGDILDREEVGYRRIVTVGLRCTRRDIPHTAGIEHIAYQT